jgi:predicted  nucleic acid-binding Zn-ribbon protein
MRTVLGIDRTRTNIENNIIEERIDNIIANTPIALGHDIFYKECLRIYTDISNKVGSTLEIAIDYSLEDIDEIASYDAQKLCYRRVSFKESHPTVYADYWVYGDTLQAAEVNEIKERIEEAEDSIEDNATAITALGGRVSANETKIGQNASNISSLNAKMETAEKEITDLQDDVKDINEKAIPGLEDDIEGLDGRVATNEGDISELKAEDTAIKGRLSTAESDITGLKSEDTAIKERISTTESDIATLKETVIPGLESDIEGLDGRVTTTEDDVGKLKAEDTAIKERLTTAEGDIAGLKSEDTAIEGRLSTAEGDITGLKSEDEIIKGRLSTAEGDITTLKETTIPGLKGDIGALGEHMLENESAVSGLISHLANEINGDIFDLQGEDEAIKSRLSAAEDKIATINETTVSGLDSKIESLDSKVTANKNDISALKQEDVAIKEDIGSAKERLTAVETGASNVNKILQGDGENEGIVAKVSRLEEFSNEKGKPLGLATLDSGGKVVLSQLPTAEDEIVEVASFDLLPEEGKAKTVYITLENNRLYRWNGTGYASLSPGSGGGGSGGSGGLYAFEIGEDGYLYMICEDNANPPNFFIDDNGYLCADLGDLETNLAAQESQAG